MINNGDTLIAFRQIAVNNESNRANSDADVVQLDSKDLFLSQEDARSFEGSTIIGSDLTSVTYPIIAIFRRSPLPIIHQGKRHKEKLQ